MALGLLAATAYRALPSTQHGMACDVMQLLSYSGPFIMRISTPLPGTYKYG